MTINWRDGLQFPEVLELAKAINIDSLLSQELHDELSAGADAGISVLSALQRVPWLFGLLGTVMPGGDIGGQIDKMLKLCQLGKALLEA